MSRYGLDRRQFLTLPLALLLAPLTRAWAREGVRQEAYAVDVGVLYNIMSFELRGTLTERIDRAAGRYELAAVGQGARIANRVESRGVRRAGRWAPLEGLAWFQVAGREARSEFKYNYARRTVEYHYRGETFLLRRRRVADDVVAIPEGSHVDDVMSAILNYADGLWDAGADGVYRTRVVRRRRPEKEGPDDVQSYYRAELVPFTMQVRKDRASGRPAALVDLTGFSSWARDDDPARIVFGPDRRPELIAASLILGTSVSIRLQDPA